MPRASTLKSTSKLTRKARKITLKRFTLAKLERLAKKKGLTRTKLIRLILKKEFPRKVKVKAKAKTKKTTTKRKVSKTRKVPTARKRRTSTKKPSVGKLTWSYNVYPYPELISDVRTVDRTLKKAHHAGILVRPSHFTGMKTVAIVADNESGMKTALKALQELDIIENAGSELRRIIKRKKAAASR